MLVGGQHSSMEQLAAAGDMATGVVGTTLYLAPELCQSTVLKYTQVHTCYVYLCMSQQLGSEVERQGKANNSTTHYLLYYVLTTYYVLLTILRTYYLLLTIY